MNSTVHGNHGSARYRAKRARPGSSRWFRRYRWLVIAGWSIAIVAVVWVLFLRNEQAPGTASGSVLVVPKDATTQAAMGAMPEVSLPADDAPHEVLTEWWYYSGHLQSASGQRYSFHIASFLRKGTLTHGVFHGSLLDHQSGKLYAEQARTAGNPADGRRDGFRLSFGDWMMQGSGGQHSAKMSGQGFGLALQMNDSLPPVLHQAPATPVAGLLDFGPAGKSYYVSRPRMIAEGTLTIGGREEKVRGEVWFDHQWGDFEAAKLRWNWFAMQLANGADLMVFELFDRKGGPVLRMGTYARNGVVSALGAEDIRTTSRGTWRSPASGVTYPVEWTISVPSQNVRVNVEPVMRSSEFDARTTTMNVYWEGAIRFSGTHTGVGFMELSGY